MGLPHVRLANDQREIATLAQRATELLDQDKPEPAAVYAQLAIASALSAALNELADIRRLIGG